MQLKLRQGEAVGRVVITDESGREIRGVQAVKFSAAVDEICTIELKVLSECFEAEGEAHFILADPRDGQVKRVRKVEFFDGSEWSAE